MRHAPPRSSTTRAVWLGSGKLSPPRWLARLHERQHPHEEPRRGRPTRLACGWLSGSVSVLLGQWNLGQAHLQFAATLPIALECSRLSCWIVIHICRLLNAIPRRHRAQQRFSKRCGAGLGHNGAFLLPALFVFFLIFSFSLLPIIGAFTHCFSDAH